MNYKNLWFIIPQSQISDIDLPQSLTTLMHNYIFFFFKQMHDYIAISCDCNQLNFKVLSIIRQASREKNNMFSHDETKLVQCPTNNYTN